jgi:hypothetical protein
VESIAAFTKKAMKISGQLESNYSVAQIAHESLIQGLERVMKKVQSLQAEWHE